MAQIYWAHSDPDGLASDQPSAHWQRLSTHLENVATIAASLARSARPGDEPFQTATELAGRLHDFGKYTECFQNMIRTGIGKCQHSIHGAVIANDTGNRDVAFAIAGHHAGVPDNNGGTGTLTVRLNDFRVEAGSLKGRAETDSPGLSKTYQPSVPPRKISPKEFDLHTRMLFSCLVDADRLDSGGRAPSFPSLDADTRLANLRCYVDGLTASDPVVGEARRQVLEDCLNAAPFPERLLSLTVPTGGGKTLSAMAFALRRAALAPDLYRRIIVVIPFLSIIEQNAEVYAKVFGADAILEHHSGSFDRLRRGDDEHFVPDPSEKEENEYFNASNRAATENWSAPLIVTTSVRFFESLFSNRPSDLRRAHNIARSIVILDEVQTLPRRLLAPLLTMIRELSDQWGCTFVFSTATQPAFQKSPDSAPKDPRWQLGSIREIVREPSRLHSALKRVSIEWELERTASWAEIADRIVRHDNALCVVNIRDNASALYDEVVSRTRAEDTFHLSTRMCAAHRLEIVNLIKLRLVRRLPCWVISTQLIEAGVDLDFDVAFRALGPLDAVMQAAGRSDREGRLTARLGQPAGRLFVFRPEGEKTPPNDYHEATELTRIMALAALRLGQPLQPDSIEQMARYWNRFYGEGAGLGEELQGMRLEARFATLSKEFEMISDRTLDVFVPYDDQARNAIDDLRRIGLLTKELRHKLRRYSVGLRPWEFDKAKIGGAVEEIRRDSAIWAAVDRAYSNTKGLKLP